MKETWVQSLGQEDLLEKGMATLSSILVWEILWIEDPGRLQSVHGIAKSRAWLSDWVHRFLALGWLRQADWYYPEVNYLCKFGICYPDTVMLDGSRERKALSLYIDLQCHISFRFIAQWYNLHVYILFQILFSYMLFQNIVYNFLLYTVGPFWLPILYIAVCIYWSHPPNLSLLPPSPW